MAFTTKANDSWSESQHQQFPTLKNRFSIKVYGSRHNEFAAEEKTYRKKLSAGS
jgi:hypothetical protein